MKAFILAASLFVSMVSHAQELRIFRAGITLRADCSLEVARPDGSVEIVALPFRHKSQCAIFPVVGTNIPRLEFVRGDYVLLIESQNQAGKECRAEQAAVVVSRAGKVRIGSNNQESGGGFNERKAFEVLHGRATH